MSDINDTLAATDHVRRVARSYGHAGRDLDHAAAALRTAGADEDLVETLVAIARRCHRKAETLFAHLPPEKY